MGKYCCNNCNEGKSCCSINEAKFTDDTLVTRLKHWSKQHKGTGIGYGHVLGQLAVHMKEMGWNKSYKEIARIAVELGKKKTVESINEGGMGILTTDQADVLQAIVMKNKNKNSKAILKIVMKDSMFKGVDKREMLGYIEGTKQFVKYIRVGRTGNESVNESIQLPQGMKLGKVFTGHGKSFVKEESVNEKMDKEQFHDYMQYVLKTQFKTPEEKKMKKSIIKKLNIANKKKGLRLFKEISGVQLAKKVVKNQQYEKGMDLFTAQYIVQTYDAYKKHPTLRKKIEKLSVAKAVKLANLVMRGS